MKTNLKNDSELGWSPIVANNAMNRKRVAIGINSYKKEIKIDSIKFLEKRKNEKIIRWMDLCCGEGNALIQAAKHFSKKDWSEKVEFTGIDLVDFFSEYEESKHLNLLQLNLEHWAPKERFDLITIVHGLHYVGDKLKLIEKSVNTLKNNGLFIGNLDLNNIILLNEKDPGSTIKNFFKETGIQYNSRTKIISAQGKKEVEMPFIYLGADDNAGPNYTGQAAVNSVYEMRE